MVGAASLSCTLVMPRPSLPHSHLLCTLGGQVLQYGPESSPPPDAFASGLREDSEVRQPAVIGVQRLQVLIEHA